MTADLKVVEKDAEALVDELGDLIEDVDISSVDLSMATGFEERVAAAERLALVKQAAQLKWAMAANKAANPNRFEELRRSYHVALWEIGLLDKRYPNAKAISLELMEIVAAQETEQQARQRESLKKSS